MPFSAWAEVCHPALDAIRHRGLDLVRHPELDSGSRDKAKILNLRFAGSE